MSGWLVVNQNVQANDQTRQQVNSRGLACETAHDWRTAEQRLHGNQFDVIVVDPKTQTDDDLSLIEHLVNDPSATNAKIVVVGQSDQTSDIEESLIRSESEMLADIDSLLEKIGRS